MCARQSIITNRGATESHSAVDALLTHVEALVQENRDLRVQLLRLWAVGRLAELTGIAATAVDTTRSLDSYGLAAPNFLAELAQQAGKPIVAAASSISVDEVIESLFVTGASLQPSAHETARQPPLPPPSPPEDEPSTFTRQRLSVLTERYIEAVDKGHYFYQRELGRDEGAWATVDGRRMLMLSSYSYLGLLGHPRINQAARDAIADLGTGTHGVRLLAGTTRMHRELERAIARFKGSDAAVVFSSGYVANVATISTLLNRGHTVICDRLNHASLFDGCVLSGAKIVVVGHNDLEDLHHALRQAGSAGKLVVIDAVYSMDGDIAPLPEIADLCDRYGATLMVDEAHSLGVLGATGRGIEEHFGLGPRVIDVKMGTLSKTIPSIGGYVAGRRDLVDALKHNARGFVFSAALPPPQVAAAHAALDVIVDEPWRVTRLHDNWKHYYSALRDLGFDTLRSTTPIVPIACGTEALAFEMTRLCHENGLFVLPIVYPAVPMKSPRLRTTVTTAHTAEDIRLALSILEHAGRRTGLI